MNVTDDGDRTESASVITTYFICELLIAFFAVFGNLAILIAFSSNRKLQTLENYYIISLATIDFSMGFFAIPAVLYTLEGEPVDRMALCFFLMTVIVLMDLCSIFSVVALTVDRFYAVCRPFSYHAVMTRRRTLLHISLAWIIPIGISMLVPLGWNIAEEGTRLCLFAEIVSLVYYSVLYFTCFLPLFFVMCLMYRRIFIVIQRQLESLAKIEAIGARLNHQPATITTAGRGNDGDGGEEQAEDERETGGTIVEASGQERTSKRGKKDWDVTDEILLLKKMEENNHGDGELRRPVATVSGAKGEGSVVDETKNTGNNEHRSEKNDTPSSTHARFRSIRQERKTAILFVFIMMFLLISWSPIYIIDVFLAFNVNVDQNLINFAVLLSHFNSALNPVLYASKSGFRRVIKKWAFVVYIGCCKLCCKGRASVVHPLTSTDGF